MPPSVRRFAAACVVPWATFLTLLLGLLAAAPDLRAERLPALTAVVLRTFPQMFVTREDAPPQGFAVDVLEDLAASLGRQVDYLVVDNWEQAYEVLAEGRAEVIPGAAMTAENQERFLFTAPFATLPICFFARAETPEARLANGTTHIRVGCMRKSLAADLLRRQGHQAVVEFDSMPHALIDLLAGDIDLLAAPQEVINRVAADNRLEDRIKPVGPVLTEVRRAVAVRPDLPGLREDLDREMGILLNTQRFLDMHARWYGVLRSPWTTTRVLLLTCGLAVLLTLGFWLERYRTLTRLNRMLSTAVQGLTSRESELNQSREQYRLLVENMADGLALMDEQGRVLDTNAAGLAALGLTREEMLARTVFDLVPGLERERFAALVRGAEPGKSIFLELEALCADGRTLPIEARATVLPVNGQRLIISTARDMTERRKAEDRVRRSLDFYLGIMEDFPAMFWRADTTGRCDYFNRTWLNFTGRTLEEEIELGWSVGLHPEDRDRVVEVYAEARAAQAPFKMEYRLRRHDGQYRWIMDLGHPYRDLDGNFAGYVGGGYDVTETREYRERIQEALALAERAGQAKSEFLANTSHEIRTPLNGILGMLQLLELTPLTDEQTGYVDTALKSGFSLLAIINDILDLAKIEAGKLRIEERALRPAQVFEGFDHLFKGQLLAKGLAFATSVDPALPGLVYADQTRLRQVLFNLIGNAVKFTESGRVEASVSLADRTQNGWAVLLFTVEDTGVGIPRDQLERIFEPFRQVDGTYRRIFQGTGLGLSIVRNLVAMMGGEVRVQSREGYGSIFTFTIRARLAGETEAGELFRARTQPRPGLRALLVEDDGLGGRVLAGMIDRLGVTPVLVKNGIQALEALEAGGFDLVFMDIQMPVMDGLEALRRLRNEPRFAHVRGTPVVAVTAHAMKGDREKFLHAGMDAFLPKPIVMEDLSRVIMRLCGPSSS